MPRSCKSPLHPAWLPRDNRRVDYSKLDRPLAAELDRGDRADRGRLPVFVRTLPQLTEEARSMLGASGIQGAAEGATVFAAELSHDEVATLSDQPWGVSVRLGNKARPLDP